MKNLALGILIGFALALSLSGSTEGLRFEALGGQCKQTRDNLGVWWNGRYETNIDLTTACYQIGVSKTPWRWRELDLGWRVAYVNFGPIKTNSVMASRDDEQEKLTLDGLTCWRPSGNGCLWRTIGGGRAKGFSFGGVAEKKLGGFVYGAEAGLFLYHNQFKIDIYWEPSGDRFEQWNRAKGWLIHPYWGVNLKYDWLYFAVRQYTKLTAHKSGCQGGCSGVANGPAWQINAGVSIPL